MEDFSRVSLGFAEFVAQLLHETFDAVLSAQNYQLEKYSELEKALSIPNASFSELYITRDEIEQKQLELFGSLLAEKMKVSDVAASVLAGLLADTDMEKAIEKGTLTSYGYSKASLAITDLIVVEKKGKLTTLINNAQMAKLIVDSGEIKAKLELSNLYESTEAIVDKEENAPTKKTPAKADIDKSATSKTGLPLAEMKKVAIKEVLDPVTKQKTLFMDKEALLKIPGSTQVMPKVRMVATPAQTTSSSNLFSEVTIKFKTI